MSEFARVAVDRQVKLFGVWGKSPDGYCCCPVGMSRQDVRGARIASAGTCEQPGKHPTPLSGIGGPDGAADGVAWDRWQELEPIARKLGAVPAAAIPEDVWVLDSDSPAAWRDVVRMFRTGAVGFEQVLCVSRTRRGYHVWLAADGGNWKSSSAQKAVRAAGFEVIEVKSAGTYVVLPGGFDGGLERAWVDVRMFAEKLSWSSRLMSGRPGAAVPESVGRLAVERGPDYAKESSWESTYPAEVFGPIDKTAVRASRWAALNERAGILACQGEGSRNVSLNRLGYFEGVAAVDAGCPVTEVAAVLRAAGIACGLGAGEVEATVRSSLRSAGVEL